MLLSGSVGAQDFTSSRSAADIRFTGVYIDNFYYNSEAEARTAALGGLVNPRLGFKSSAGKIDLSLVAESELATFDTPGNVDDYSDGRANGSLSWLATRRSRFDLRAGLVRGHDPFGINRTENSAVLDQDLDVWHGRQVGMLFHYGAPEATVNAEIGVSGLDKAYQTNEAATRFLDYRSTSVQYTLFYNYSPKTAALFDFIRSNVEFDEAFSAVENRSGDEYRIRTGVRWLASAKTSGDVRIGAYRREFEDTAFTDEGLDWQAGMQWAPRARTVLELNTGRASQESYRADTFVNNTRRVTLGWKQSWSARANSQLRLDSTRTEFVGSTRWDKLYNAALSVDYLLSSRLALVLGLETLTRDSNEPTSEFDRFSSYLGIRLGS